MSLIRPELLGILACPHCYASGLRYIDGDEPQIECPACQHKYGFENNIPLLYRDDEFWKPKQREANGWVAMWKEEGIYEMNKTVPPDINLPFSANDGPWADVKEMFRAALSQMSLTGNERTLDIGAGEGWASYHFASRGCHAVAMDVVSDPVLGLGRAWKRMEQTGVRYDLLIGDNERLPFQPDTFDYVFSSNTLHHSNNLDHLFRGIFRVLRPGGRLIAVGDPLVTLFQRESDATDGERERSHGIVERRRHFYDYLIPLLRAGFRGIHAEDAQTFWKSNSDLYPWMDLERYTIDENPLAGTTAVTKALTWTMLRLPRPFAVPLLLSLRKQSLLLINAQKPL